MALSIFCVFFISQVTITSEADDKKMDRKEFNESIITGNIEYEDWMSDPVAVSLRYLGPFEGRSQTIQRTNPSAESSDTTQVVIINEGLLDDSIRAEKYEFTLKTFNNRWVIYSEEKFRKCWPDRGHTNFSKKPCS
ncbi:MAG: hypothetical protein AAF462_06900 [Thermodesulfobacteriota bacterium]